MASLQVHELSALLLGSDSDHVQSAFAYKVQCLRHMTAYKGHHFHAASKCIDEMLTYAQGAACVPEQNSLK